jgi:peptide chain release factor 1
LKNRNKAMAVLRSRLLEVETRKQREQIDSSRRTQVGSGDRAEKIRTYNFPQDRMTDHRPPYTRHNLPILLDGDVDDVIDALEEWDENNGLEAALA